MGHQEMNGQQIVLAPTSKHMGTVIFIHGLGDSGKGWVSGMQVVQATNPQVKFILPSAPQRTVTAWGRVMPAWFDVAEPGNTSDREGLEATRAKIMELVEAEVKLGIPSERILIGGFSQGAVTSMFTVYQSSKPLGGCIALSGYLAFPTIFQTLINNANIATPLLMYHGEADNVLPFSLGTKAHELLQNFGLKNTRFVAIPNMPHSVTTEELNDVAAFVRGIIPMPGKEEL